MRLFLLQLFLAVTAFAAELKPLELSGVREEHAMIQMRDGTRLSAYLYYPPGEGPWPVIFEQRYLDVTGASTRKNSAEMARTGFVVAMVNFRGSQQSEGTWAGYRALGWGEKQDGYDTCEWLGTQPWSTGKVGSFGSSQGGFAQNFLAVTQPPHLVCQYMVDTGLSLFHEGYRIGGVTRPQRFLDMAKVVRDPAHHQALLREWDQHPDYDRYWEAEDCARHFEKMTLPCFTIGSWFDFMNQGSIASFQGRRPHAPQQQLLLGPWLHGRLNKGSKVGELQFPENATFPEREHLTRWFAHYLKGEDNGVEREPAVRYYVMGATGEPGAPGNVWRSAESWPPPAAEQSWFLQESGALSTTPPAQADSHTSYESDPAHPMSIPGTSFPGARDARPFEQQPEVRTFTSAPLSEPLEWTGPVQVELHASSTARDTDFIVRVSDVYPDGRSILLFDYPLRARYREGFQQEHLLTPGEITTLRWRLGHTSIVFNRGHSIRVTIASTGAPLYEPNNQTGGPQTLDWLKESIKATNTIWHNPLHASRIIAPVVRH